MLGINFEEFKTVSCSYKLTVYQTTKILDVTKLKPFADDKLNDV